MLYEGKLATPSSFSQDQGNSFDTGPLATLNQLLIHTKVSENVNVYILNYV